MRQIMLAAAVTGTALAGSYGSAAAQVVVETTDDVQVTRRYAVPEEGYVYERRYVYERSPRVYTYRYYRAPADAEVVIRRAPAYRGGCGPNHFWDGGACVDVRFRD